MKRPSKNNRMWVLFFGLLTVVSYYESSIGTDFGPTTRIRIIFGFLFIQTFGLIVLGLLIQGLINDLRDQHRAATQIATIRGLWRALEAGANEADDARDGIPIETRRAIYEAGDEAFRLYDQLVRHEVDGHEQWGYRVVARRARQPVRGS